MTPWVGEFVSKKNRNIGFLFSLAAKNILHHKKHLFMVIFGFSISLTILLSLNTWATTAKHLAVNDFLEKQDFQAYMFSSQNPEDITLVQESLQTNPLVELYTTAYTSAALFNTENKPLTYVCLPEETQNQSDPVSITNALITNQTTLDQIRFMFYYEGNFTVNEQTILLSLKEAEELSTILNQEITVGSKVNLSIAKKLPNPAYGQDRIESFLPTMFQNFTVGAIYTVKESVSVIESAVKVDWLADSIIFPLAKLNSSDRDVMAVNDVPYILFIKFNKEELTKNGFENILNTMTLFSEQIKKDYPAMFIFVFKAPLETLLAAYTRASYTIVFTLPVIVVTLVLTVETTNITIKARKQEVALLRDRGADTVQIIFLFILEFILATIIGMLLGIALSFFLAALIPAFPTGTFQPQIFRLFLKETRIAAPFFFGTTAGLGAILIGFASFKVWWEMSQYQQQTDYGQKEQKQIERKVFLGIQVGGAIITIIALLLALIKTLPEVRAKETFSAALAADAGYAFVLTTILLVFLSLFLATVVRDWLFPKMHWLYKRLLITKAFFLQNNLRRKDKRLSQITYALFIATAVMTFSLVTAVSIAQMDAKEHAYRNGADLRIATYPLDESFKENISAIEEINEVVPIFKTKGSIAYNDYTVYGVEPTSYSRVGKWDESSFPEGNSFENLYALGETANGIIIGKRLAEQLNLTVGDNLPLNNLPGGIYSRRFTIVGIINSAPGLGLADGRNLELLQPYDGYVVINEDYFKNELRVRMCQLFLASVYPDASVETAAEKVNELLANIEVNPEELNEQFIGTFITNYLPKAKNLFWMAVGIIAVVMITLVVVFTDFTLKQRTQELAIKMALGEKRREISKEILTEQAIISTTATLIGMGLGIAFVYGTGRLLIPLITAQTILPFTLTIPGGLLAAMAITQIIMNCLGIMPTRRKYRKEKIISALRGE